MVFERLLAFLPAYLKYGTELPNTCAVWAVKRRHYIGLTHSRPDTTTPWFQAGGFAPAPDPQKCRDRFRAGPPLAPSLVDVNYVAPSTTPSENTAHTHRFPERVVFACSIDLDDLRTPTANRFFRNVWRCLTFSADAARESQTLNRSQWRFGPTHTLTGTEVWPVSQAEPLTVVAIAHSSSQVVSTLTSSTTWATLPSQASVLDNEFLGHPVTEYH
jgi:hypothetical protein